VVVGTVAVRVVVIRWRGCNVEVASDENWFRAVLSQEGDPVANEFIKAKSNV
jgi:hypothetical protein